MKLELIGFYRERLHVVATGVTTYLYSKQVDEGNVVVVESIGYVSNAAGNKNIIVSIDTLGYDHNIILSFSSSSYPYLVGVPIVSVNERERLKFQIDTTSYTTSYYEIHLTGKLYKILP